MSSRLRVVGGSQEDLLRMSALSDFELFWEAYPRRKAKADAAKAWRQTEPHRPPIEEILAAINDGLKTDQWSRDGGAYIPYPATWLRRWQWADEE